MNYCKSQSKYNHPFASVKLNNITEWFDISSKVKQWDSMSPTLFGLFINDLIILLSMQQTYITKSYVIHHLCESNIKNKVQYNKVWYSTIQ